MIRRNTYSVLLLFIVSFFFAGCGEDATEQTIIKNGLSVEKFVIHSAGNKEHNFQLEIADTEETRIKGLSNRDDLSDDQGMIFLSEDRRPQVFAMWMKDTRIPLDMLFVDEKGEIQHIHWEAEPYSLETIAYFAPVLAVIELKGGVTLDKDIRPGDIVVHPFFNNQGLKER